MSILSQKPTLCEAPSIIRLTILFQLRKFKIFVQKNVRLLIPGVVRSHSYFSQSHFGRLERKTRPDLRQVRRLREIENVNEPQAPGVIEILGEELD